MPSKRTSEAAFETAIESILLADGYTRVDSKAFDRERALFPDEALAFIRAIQGKVWDKLEALHGEHTSARVLESLFIERMELNEELL
jgi:type I restriction enzyme R subunit